jgi:hypothetical protein
MDVAWRHRQKITVINSNTAAVPAAPFRLELPFREGMRRKMQDVRLTAGDGRTPLGFWVEHVVPEQKAVVWLRLPEMPGGRGEAPGKTRIYAYFGNRTADAGGGFDAVFRKLQAAADTVGLWHCDEGGGGVLHDASSHGNDLTVVEGAMVWDSADGGHWGPCTTLRFGQGSSVTLPGDGQRRYPYLTPAPSTALCLTGFTWEVWIRLDRAYPEAGDNFALIRQGSGLCYHLLSLTGYRFP